MYARKYIGRLSRQVSGKIIMQVSEKKNTTGGFCIEVAKKCRVVKVFKTGKHDGM